MEHATAKSCICSERYGLDSPACAILPLIHGRGRSRLELSTLILQQILQLLRLVVQKPRQRPLTQIAFPSSLKTFLLRWRLIVNMKASLGNAVSNTMTSDDRLTPNSNCIVVWCRPLQHAPRFPAAGGTYPLSCDVSVVLVTMAGPILEEKCKHTIGQSTFTWPHCPRYWDPPVEASQDRNFSRQSYNSIQANAASC